MRNGFSTEVARVKDFNKMVINQELKHRALGNIYVQLTIKGNFRKTGFVAYDYDQTVWAKTKKEALNKINQRNKVYYQRDNIGKAKYCVFTHDGIKTHKDGSSFFDIDIFTNKKKVSAYIKKLIKEGYTNKFA